MWAVASTWRGTWARGRPLFPVIAHRTSRAARPPRATGESGADADPWWSEKTRSPCPPQPARGGWPVPLYHADWVPHLPPQVGGGPHLVWIRIRTAQILLRRAGGRPPPSARGPGGASRRGRERPASANPAGGTGVAASGVVGTATTTTTTHNPARSMPYQLVRYTRILGSQSILWPGECSFPIVNKP